MVIKTAREKGAGTWNDTVVGMTKKIKALGLTSGGLDSILAALVLRRQGIDVTWVSFETPFFDASSAQKAAKQHDIPILVEDITSAYLPMVKEPPGGYGKAMNPCRDCHAMMFRLAGEIMTEKGFDFLFSGEVAGQRPMSQTKPALRYVEKRSGHDGRILRPLSAKILPETRVEAEGLVDRELLLDFQGRSRKPQMALAKEMGVTDYPTPAGGCLLTDLTFGKRLKDLFDHHPDACASDCHLLKFGRHFRLSDTTKLVVGRTRGDNEKIVSQFDSGCHLKLKTEGIAGPVALIPGAASPEEVELAAGIMAGYTKAAPDADVTLRLSGRGENRVFTVRPLKGDRVRDLMI